MSIEKVLIVDEETLVRDVLAETLAKRKVEVTTAESGKKALNILKDHPFDMVITDIKLPDMTGIDVLRKIKEIFPHTLVIVITSHGSIENAVEVMRLGAYTYLVKPFSPDAIEAILDKPQEHPDLPQHVSTTAEHSTPPRVIGESPAMKKILSDIAHVAASNASVFIQGESGTGKEVIANAIHYQSTRSNRPFIKVNCAAIPDTLIESEFFGHEKGAFTGANSKRLGRFELAHGGTLLLDEVTEIPQALQSKLLRVIQEQIFERVGGTKPVHVDVRLISTTNRDIKDAISNKTIREDLYYRLNVVPIYIPPLRERHEDILPLAEYFLQRMCQENRREEKELTAEAKKKLLEYPWPGNARELANVIERAIVIDNNKLIPPDQILLEKPVTLEFKFPPGMTLQELEKRLIIETMAAHENDKNKTAEALGISLRTLSSKLRNFATEGT